MRRAIGKSIMAVVKSDVEKHAGALQLCAGQSAGVEAAIHIYEAESCDGILLLDAENAFNRANRAAALWNIQYDCPALKCTVINTYRRATKIFVLGGLEIWSNEGTTQGCPLAMAMYAVAIIPLQELLHEKCKQVWFADDGTGGDTIKKMRNWWDCVAKNGPKFGYFPKASKSWLIVKKHKKKEAERNWSSNHN